MFISHYGLALAVKHAESGLSLVALSVAARSLLLLWLGFVSRFFQRSVLITDSPTPDS